MLDARAQAFAGQANHLRALVDPDDVGAAAQELLCVQAGAAPRHRARACPEHPRADPGPRDGRTARWRRCRPHAARSPQRTRRTRGGSTGGSTMSIMQEAASTAGSDRSFPRGRTRTSPDRVAVPSPTGRAVQVHRGFVRLVGEDPDNCSQPSSRPSCFSSSIRAHGRRPCVGNPRSWQISFKKSSARLSGWKISTADRNPAGRPSREASSRWWRSSARNRRGLVGAHVVVERCPEPGHFGLVGRTGPVVPGPLHRLPSCERNGVLDRGGFAQLQPLLHVRDDGAVVKDERCRDAVEDRSTREQRPGREDLCLPATRCPRRRLHDAGARRSAGARVDQVMEVRTPRAPRHR